MRIFISSLVTVIVLAACSGSSSGTPSASVPVATTVATVAASSAPPEPSPSAAPSVAPSEEVEAAPVTPVPSVAPTAPPSAAPSTLPPVAPGESFESATTIEVQLRTAESTITSTTNTSAVACERDAPGGSGLRVTFENPGTQQGVSRLEVLVPDTEAPRQGFTATVEYSSGPDADPYRLTEGQVRRNSIDVADRGSSASIAFAGDVRNDSLAVTIDCHQIGG